MTSDSGPQLTPEPNPKSEEQLQNILRELQAIRESQKTSELKPKSDDELLIIVREEQALQRLRENQKTRGQRIWSWLNSAFGLWVLTTVVVTFGTFLFTYFSAKRALERAAIDEAGRISKELGLRLLSFHNDVAYLKKEFEERKMQGTLPRPMYRRLQSAYERASLPVKSYDTRYQTKNTHELLIDLQAQYKNYDLQRATQVEDAQKEWDTISTSLTIGEREVPFVNKGDDFGVYYEKVGGFMDRTHNYLAEGNLHHLIDAMIDAKGK